MEVKLCIIKSICYMVVKTCYMVEKIYHMTNKDFCLSYDKHIGDPRPQCSDLLRSKTVILYLRVIVFV